MKLHIQLEPYTGVKFDFVEIDVESFDQVKEIYAGLEATYGTPKAISAPSYAKKATSTPFGGGAPRMTKPVSEGQKKWCLQFGKTEEEVANMSSADASKFLEVEFAKRPKPASNNY